MTVSCPPSRAIQLRPYQAEAVAAVYEHLRTRARQGAELRQRAKEAALMNELGLTVAQASPAAPAVQENTDEPADPNA